MAKKATIHPKAAKAEANNQPQQPQWERARVICGEIKISNSTLWHWTKTRSDFPKPVKAGPRVTLFDLTAINQWLQNQTEATQ